MLCMAILEGTILKVVTDVIGDYGKFPPCKKHSTRLYTRRTD